jgi:hypothetical protein
MNPAATTLLARAARRRATRPGLNSVPVSFIGVTSSSEHKPDRRIWQPFSDERQEKPMERDSLRMNGDSIVASLSSIEEKINFGSAYW